MQAYQNTQIQQTQNTETAIMQTQTQRKSAQQPKLQPSTPAQTTKMTGSKTNAAHTPVPKTTKK